MVQLQRKIDTKPYRERISFLIKTVLIIAMVLIGYSVATMPARLLLIYGGLLVGSAIAFALGYKSFFGIFVSMILISYFQGTLQYHVRVPVDPGLLKYLLLLAGGVLLLMRHLLRQHLRISRVMQTFLFAVLLYYTVFAVTLYHASLPLEDISQALSDWSILNVLLAVFIYLDLRSLRSVYRFMSAMILAGCLAALFGAIQFVLGPTQLQVLGFDFSTNQFAFFLGEDNPSSFRPMSFFPTFYEYASFMMVCIVAQIVLMFRSGRRCTLWDFSILVLLIGALLTTLHLTTWLTVVLAVTVIAIGLSGRGLRVLKSKRIWRNIGIALFVGGLILMLVPLTRERVLGIFEFGDAGAVGTAGKSFWWRLNIMNTSFELIREFPFGIGISAQLRSPLLDSLLLQRGWFLVTSDAFFVWQALTGGGLLFVCFFGVLVLPVVVGFRRRRRIASEHRPLFWGIWSLLFVGILLGGISNSALLNGTPTNLIMWASVGVLYKLLIWSQPSPACSSSK